MWKYLCGALVLVPVAAVACGDDDDQTAGSGAAAGASNEAGAGGVADSAGGSGGTENQGGGGVTQNVGGGAGSADHCAAYDLDSYDGDTDGLCDAAEVKACDFELCGDYGAALSVLCAPDKSGCIWAAGVCTSQTECGWVDCDVARDDEFCEGLEEMVDDVKESGGPERCVSDADCSAPATCSRRIANMMVCDPVDSSNGGAGGGAEN
jgi:hypothetical protein